MFSAVRKRKAKGADAARVDVLNDPHRPRPFKPEWLLEADKLTPTVRVVEARAHAVPPGVARRGDEVETSLDEAYPRFRMNRVDRRARRFASRATRRAAFSARLAATQDADKAAVAYEAWVAGCRGRKVVETANDGTVSTSYLGVVEPKDAGDKLAAYARSNPGRTLSPAQSRRLRKTRNKAIAA